MTRFHPRPAVEVANEIFALVDTGHHDQALMKMCSLLSALDKGVVTTAGFRRKINFVRLVAGTPAASYQEMHDLLSDPEQRTRFIDAERKLLVDAGTDERLVAYTMTQMERRLDGLALNHLDRKGFEPAMARLRDMTCSQVTARAAIREAVRRIGEPTTKRNTLFLLGGLITTAVDIPLSDEHPVVSNLSMNFGASMATGAVMAIFPEEHEQEGGPVQMA